MENTHDPGMWWTLREEINSLRAQLSDCTLAREAETINCRSFMKRAERWEERATAAEAALAEAVKERDELIDLLKFKILGWREWDRAESQSPLDFILEQTAIALDRLEATHALKDTKC